MRVPQSTWAKSCGTMIQLDRAAEQAATTRPIGQQSQKCRKQGGYFSIRKYVAAAHTESWRRSCFA
jgi:sarcosine oxidase delta subunit